MSYKVFSIVCCIGCPIGYIWMENTARGVYHIWVVLYQVHILHGIPDGVL